MANRVDGEFKKVLTEELKARLTDIGDCINGGATAFTKHKSVYAAHAINIHASKAKEPAGMAACIFESIIRNEYFWRHLKTGTEGGVISPIKINIVFRSLSLELIDDKYQYYVRFAFEDKTPQETIDDYEAKNSNALYEPAT